MTLRVLTSLISTQAAFEQVRDRIVAILQAECTNQKALASGESEDPTEWDFLVVSDEAGVIPEVNTPVVIVGYSEGTVDYRGSTFSGPDLRHTAIFTMSVVARRAADEDEESEASRNAQVASAEMCQWVAGLVLRILASQVNATLQYASGGIVRDRRIIGIKQVYPGPDNSLGVGYIQIQMQVECVESIPTGEGIEVIETVSIAIKNPAGSVVAELREEFT